VRIYLAGVRDPRAKRVCAELGVRNYLLSFSLKQRAFDQNSDVLENPECRVMVDSGAFSVWNTGRKIDVKKYADFAHKLMARARCELLLCPQNQPRYVLSRNRVCEMASSFSRSLFRFQEREFSSS
jgi:hypothetical protein